MRAQEEQRETGGMQASLGAGKLPAGAPWLCAAAPCLPRNSSSSCEASMLCARSLRLSQLLSEAELEQLLDRNHVFADDLASGADAGGEWAPGLCLCRLLNLNPWMDGSGMVGLLCQALLAALLMHLPSLLASTHSHAAGRGASGQCSAHEL